MWTMHTLTRTGCGGGGGGGGGESEDTFSQQLFVFLKQREPLPLHGPLYNHYHRHLFINSGKNCSRKGEKLSIF